MSESKKSQKQTPGKGAHERGPFDDSVDGLANLIAAVLNHPLVPAVIYNRLRGTFDELNIDEAINTPEYIGAVLRVSGVGQKGGGR